MREFDVLLLTETRADYIPDDLFPEHSIAFCPASRAGRQERAWQLLLESLKPTTYKTGPQMRHPCG